MSEKLSIIVPMYNVEKYIEKCLLSTQQQDIPSTEYEVIVVNDGSPDKSKERAEAIAEKYTNIRVVSRPNGGLSAARNTGIREAKGDYIMFLDSDDWIEENCLGRIIAKLNEEKPDILCICSCRNNGEKQYAIRSFKDTTSMSGPKALAKGLSPEAPFSIVKTSFLKENNFRFYEGIYHEDSELTPRMHYMASKISFLDGLVYDYYVNDQSIMGKPNPKKSHDLINVVCPRLSQFCDEHVMEGDKYIFHNMISMYLNNSINFILKCDKADQEKFNKCFANVKQLLSHYRKSTVLKYRIEGYLFTLFPKHALGIYKLLFSLRK